MDLTLYSSPGRDQYDRKFPVKITFKTGEIVYGHFKSSRLHSEGIITKTINIHFLLIKNIEDWCNNINEEIEKRDVIIFDDDLIEQISNFKSY